MNKNIMRHLFKIIIGFLLLFIYRTENVLAQPIASIASCNFYLPDHGPYIELYISINGSSVKYRGTTDTLYQANLEDDSIFEVRIEKIYRANLEVNLTIKQDDKEIYTDKYNLHNQTIDSLIPANLCIFDLQRIPLASGEYVVSTKIKDLNDTTFVYSTSQKIKLPNSSETIAISDIELIDSYSKSNQNSKFTKVGYDIIPYLYNFFPESVTSLSFYTEIYNLANEREANKKFIVDCYIENADTKKALDQYFKFKRLDTASVNVLFNSFAIDKLASGNYNLVVEIKNQENQSVNSKKIFFQRSNTQTDSLLLAQLPDPSQGFVATLTSVDSLKEYIKCLYPISSDYEKKFANNQIEMHDLKLMQQYFLYFWQKRNALDPEQAWKNYYADVLRVNHNFGSKIHKGYETDRGRVYLQYGPPNQRTQVEHEPNTYPYEIWHYYKLSDGQSNRKFVFCNTDLVTNEYNLIHSDARGELYNSKWNILLHKRHSNITDLDTNEEQDYYGSKSLEYYQSPR